MNIKSNRIMEEKKELNLVEILKDCPKGTRLYSTIYGEVSFEKIDNCDGAIYPIRFYKGRDLQCVSKNGLHLVEHDGECTLFPGKENRDWSTFKEEKPKWNPETLQPFDKVLVRDDKKGRWTGDFYLYTKKGFTHRCVYTDWPACVPYNEETKHLLGTSQEAPEYYRQ